MAFLRTIFKLGIISSFLIQIQGADKYTDGNRPYEFGFNIEGEQHRQEKKDEKGLIMGEFGFITADGVYHVTVYATDEQGRFKILSMKNIRVKPYPTYKRPQAGSARQGHALEMYTIPNGPVRPNPKTNLKKISIEPPARSCSSCSLPSTTTQAPAQSFGQPNIQNTPSISNSNNYGQDPTLVNPQDAKTNSFPNQKDTFSGQNVGSSPSFPARKQNDIRNPQQGSVSSQNALGQGFVSNQNLPTIPSGPQITQPQGFGSIGQSGRDGITSGRTAKKYEEQPKQEFGSAGSQPNGVSNGEADFNQGQTLPNKPTLISAQMQIVDKNTDIYKRGPGEREGLPNGLTKGDMSQLLYTFNYTVGFHGHFEEGYRNGAKQGYYYVTGRNGVRTRVDYVADEKGFRPKITQEVLDLLSDDVPKPETEKDEKYGLKGYEFKWLYFPVESNGH